LVKKQSVLLGKLRYLFSYIRPRMRENYRRHFLAFMAIKIDDPSDLLPFSEAI
jgi:hypothetical protein